MSSQNLSENPASSLEALSEFAGRDHHEAPETYRAALEAVVDVLSQQDIVPRLSNLPTIIIPDLHARRTMLTDILSAPIGAGSSTGEQVFGLLQKGLINVVCVGDIVHSEEPSNWVINRDGEWTPALLDKEMVRSLGAGIMVMYLKLQFPDHFHCLRGNHDDMVMEFGPFRKFVGLRRDEQDEVVVVEGRPVLTGDKGESELVRDWVLTREGWGQAFLDAWTQFERALPLFAQGSYFVVSHTLPRIPLSEAALHDPGKPREVTSELTQRRGVNGDSIVRTLENLGIKSIIQRWFYGHTPVSAEKNGGKYEEGLDGLLIRLNNPKNYVFAYVPASDDERRFDPIRDVYIKSPAEEHFHL
ncbi:MAG TPA: metallophosphoesterase [Ktedonobacteraceae bacterium]|nr:metallophosphoesterase [Ktedonobacteraceae bacterium]